MGQVKDQVCKSLAVLPQLALLGFTVVQVSPEAILLIEVWGGGPARCLAVPSQLLQCPLQSAKSLLILDMCGMNRSCQHAKQSHTDVVLDAFVYDVFSLF